MSTQSVSSRGNVFIKKSEPAFSLRGLIAILSEWRRRAVSRQELASLSPLELRDLGQPDRIAAEKAKPFWRA